MAYNKKVNMLNHVSLIMDRPSRVYRLWFSACTRTDNGFAMY